MSLMGCACVSDWDQNTNFDLDHLLNGIIHSCCVRHHLPIVNSILSNFGTNNAHTVVQCLCTDVCGYSSFNSEATILLYMHGNMQASRMNKWANLSSALY